MIVIEFFLKAWGTVKRTFLSVVPVALYPCISYDKITSPVTFWTNSNLNPMGNTILKKKVIYRQLKPRLKGTV